MDVCLRRGVVCRSAAVGVGGGVKGSGNGVRGRLTNTASLPYFSRLLRLDRSCCVWCGATKATGRLR